MSPSLDPPPSKVTEFTGWIRWFQNLYEKRGRIENWHEVGTGSEPSFAGTWENYVTGSYDTAAFYKDPYGVVHIKGLVKLGTLNTVIFILPEGYRPPLTQMFASIDGTNAPCRLDIRSDGTVITTGSSSNAFQSIWCSFRV